MFPTGYKINSQHVRYQDLDTATSSDERLCENAEPLAQFECALTSFCCLQVDRINELLRDWREHILFYPKIP